MWRKLSINFKPNRDVEYYYHRSEPLKQYTINWPSYQVILKKPESWLTIKNSAGFLVATPKNTKEVYEIGYIKTDFLQKEGDFLRYREDITIKGPDFGIWLGSPYEELSAMKRYSTAVFLSYKGSRRYTPWQLTEEVFDSRGVLSVNWLLEILPKI